MHNPFRSEADAFRLVIIFGVGATAVIALTLLTEPIYGVILAAALIGLGAGATWAGSRGSEPHTTQVAARPDRRFRVLVVANETVKGDALLEELRNRFKGREGEALVVSPALVQSRLQELASDTDEATAQARERLARSVAAIERLGIETRGEVGDSDPVVAVEDALREFGANEVVISTHPPGRSKWLERGVVDRIRREAPIPVTHVVVDLDAEAAKA